MPRLALRSVRIGALLFVALSLVGCPTDPDPAECADSKGTFNVGSAPESWCVGEGQVVTPEGLCECTATDQTYDLTSGACTACSSYNCANNECGSDGCDGSCGRCPAGRACVDGKCQSCVGTCADRQCGDDGCGRSCGSCELNLTCEAGRCVPKQADSPLTACSCSSPPPWYLNVRFPHAGCPNGVAIIEACSDSETECNAQGLTPWQMKCTMPVTGDVVWGCNCGVPPARQSLLYSSSTYRVDYAACSDRVARISPCPGTFCCDAPTPFPIVSPYGQPGCCDANGYCVPPQRPMWMATCDKCNK